MSAGGEIPGRPSHIFSEYVHNSEYVCVSFQIPRGLSELFTASRDLLPYQPVLSNFLVCCLLHCYLLPQPKQQLRYCCECFWQMPLPHPCPGRSFSITPVSKVGSIETSILPTREEPDRSEQIIKFFVNEVLSAPAVPGNVSHYFRATAGLERADGTRVN